MKLLLQLWAPLIDAAGSTHLGLTSDPIMALGVGLMLWAGAMVTLRTLDRIIVGLTGARANTLPIRVGRKAIRYGAYAVMFVVAFNPLGFDLSPLLGFVGVMAFWVTHPLGWLLGGAAMVVRRRGLWPKMQLILRQFF